MAGLSYNLACQENWLGVQGVSGPQSTVRVSGVLPRRWEMQSMDTMLHTREPAKRARTSDTRKQQGSENPQRERLRKI